ncbi:hypothetical protein RHSP_32095 [Rhizobium freirei PRF 81]|uniref:Uncharacterized protein n=1 Tax=Rhizobium freirei PRF 81 TaxID=363754 RepID=N6UWQ7_9HYPH|nr:hypothetical protein [Rhizobium freirei]ENN86080.1 hypothetical protein RHSP_32095 [Rhizobium freirei PRF 81]
MIFVPALFLLFLVILFPRFTKFMLTLFAFGILFAVASCVDHAHAQVPSEAMMRNAISFANCTAANAELESGKLHQIKMLGGDEVAVLVTSCAPVIDSYVHFCRASGYAEDHCYGDLRIMAEDALRKIGD